MATQYDDIAKHYATSNRMQNLHARIPYEWVKEQVLKEIKGCAVLDVACGSGDSSRMLAEMGAYVYGVDVSEGMIAEARENEIQSLSRERITFAVHDIRQPMVLAGNIFKELPRDSTFPLITVVYLLGYAESYQELCKMALTMRLNLARGGRVIITNSHVDHPVTEHVKGCSIWIYWIDEPNKDGSRCSGTLFDAEGQKICDIYFRHWTRETITRAFLSVGFTRVEFCDFDPALYKKCGVSHDLMEYESRMGIVVS